MSLTTFTFILFLTIFLLIYFLVPKKYQWLSLLIFSIIFLFYNNFNINMILYCLIILISSYLGSLLIEKYEGTKKSKLFCILSVLIILIELLVLKYNNLLYDIINPILNLLNIDYNFIDVYRNVPLGLSYYSLIMMGYIIDVYRGITKCEHNIFKCALFMSYFPVLTSGPFISHNEVSPQMYNEHKFDFNRFYIGLFRMFFGIFKVLVISSRIGIFVDSIYGDLSAYSNIFIILSIFVYPLQLYTNFSGCLDIIIGVSNIIGIKLPENFTNPFLSTSMTEFWRNWHITLGVWLKNYIFYPVYKSKFIQNLNKICKKMLGKKVGSKIPLYLSLLILWFAIGIWHGGEYKYILASGLIQFVYLVIEDIFSPLTKDVKDTSLYKILGRLRVFIAFSFAMIFFRADSITSGINILQSSFTPNGTLSLSNTGINIYDIVILVFSLIFMFIFEKNRELNLEKINSYSISKKLTCIFSIILIVLLLGLYGIGFDSTDFIYGRF